MGVKPAVKELEYDILNKHFCKKMNNCAGCPIKGNMKDVLCVEIRYRPKISTVRKLLKRVNR